MDVPALDRGRRWEDTHGTSAIHVASGAATADILQGDERARIRVAGRVSGDRVGDYGRLRLAKDTSEERRMSGSDDDLDVSGSADIRPRNRRTGHLQIVAEDSGRAIVVAAEEAVLLRVEAGILVSLGLVPRRLSRGRILEPASGRDGSGVGGILFLPVQHP